MHRSIDPRGRPFARFGPLLRALLFAAAAGIGCGLAVAAADDTGKPVVEAPSKATTDPTVTVPPPASASASGATDATDAKTDSGKKTQRRRAHIQIGDDEFDSFGDAMHTAPWVVGMAFLVASTIFLTPIILLIGIIWYKLRKTRLQNEVVLRLAEKGVMPSAEAVDAVMSGAPPQATASSAMASSAAPVYQQAVISRRRAVWSDLRRGVILTALGLAFVFYSLVDSASANWVGLVLTFLGIGYIILWWFEDRLLQRREAGVGVDVGKS